MAQPNLRHDSSPKTEENNDQNSGNDSTHDVESSIPQIMDFHARCHQHSYACLENVYL
jgi:hypothetical protein